MNKREFLKSSVAVAAVAALRGVAQTNEVPRTNWSGNLRYHTDHVLQPVTVTDVQDAVRSVAKVRALGTRHSFNGIADSSVAQISTLKITDIQLDPASKTVRVGAGTKYGDLALAIDRKGWALHNLASLPHISVGGAVATATHGSGIHNGNLSTVVEGIEFVAADGSVQTLSRAKDGDQFAGAVVGLGALGVVTHLTLRVQQTYRMTQVVYNHLPFDVLEKHLHDVMGASYSVSLFTDWQNGRADEVWLKRRVDQNGTDAPPAAFYGATLSAKPLHPVRSQSAENTTEQGNVIGPWYERLPHFRMGFTPSTGQEIQTEYFVPFDRGYEAIRAVETLRDRITPHLYITEIRSIAADDLWMSMAYKRPSLALHFTWKPEMNALLEILPQIEAKLAPFGPRPHWAKVFTMKPAPQYTRLGEFKQLVSHYDPQGKFRNEFLEKMLYA